tara:strand:+ start:2687 stop:3265 length:579 start_codon:yes stop_codon:yes gene_type:complete
MSKDDFNSKVGKSALDGLLNRKKPVVQATPLSEGRYPYGVDSSRNDWDSDFRGYDSDAFAGRSSGRKFEPSYQTSDVKTTQPKWLQGKARLASKGDASGQLRFEQDGRLAIVGENAIRNVKVAVRTKILDELRSRGVHVKLGEDHVIDAFVNDLLIGGSCQVKKKTGSGFLTIQSEDCSNDFADDNLQFNFD